jgi:hypothetical protein
LEKFFPRWPTNYSIHSRKAARQFRFEELFSARFVFAAAKNQVTMGLRLDGN